MFINTYISITYICLTNRFISLFKIAYLCLPLIKFSLLRLVWRWLPFIGFILPGLGIIDILLLNMVDNLDLFLFVAQSDWSFDQYSLGLDYDEYNTTYDLKSSWLDTVIGNGNGSSNNSGGGSSNNNVGGSPNNNGGGSPNNNGGGSPNNNGGSSQTETVIDSTPLVNYLENKKGPCVQLKDIGIRFRIPKLHNSNEVNDEMSGIAINIRRQDHNYEVFPKHNPSNTFVTDRLIDKVINFQIPPTANGR
jgi:hypothetical protein